MAAEKQIVRPSAVSASGVTRVRARPRIERDATRRTPAVYPSLTRTSAVSRDTLGRGGGGTSPGKETPHLVPVDDRRRDAGDQDSGGDVEPEVVTGRHHRDPHPDRPGEPDRLHEPRAHE